MSSNAIFPPTRHRLFLRFVAFTLIGVFCLREGVCYGLPEIPGLSPAVSIEALSQDPTRLEVPADFSLLKEIHKGSNGTFIIHIQDAHSNLSGQQNLARTLEELITKYGVSLVLVEGGSVEGSLGPLKGIATPEITKRAAKSLLREGQISGEEYLSLVSDHPFRIVGIEEMPLYLHSVEKYGELADKREAALEYLRKIQASIDKLKTKFYPQEILVYEKQKKNRAEEAGRFPDQQGLLELISRAPFDLSEFPNIRKIQGLQSREKTIDFGLANLEQAALVEQIQKQGGAEELQQSLSKWNHLKRQTTSQYTHLQNLFEIARKRNIVLSKYPTLGLYRVYLEQFSAIDLDELLAELEGLEDKVYASMLAGSDARLLRSIDRYTGLLESAHHIRMSSKEFRFFIDNEPDFATVAYLAFLNRKLVERGFFGDILPLKDTLEEGRKSLAAFYDSVEKRDHAFLRNAERILLKEGKKVAVLITGGYHTQNLKKLLKEKGNSFAVVAPLVTTETDQARYEKLLLSTVRKEKRVETAGNDSFSPGTEKARYLQAALRSIDGPFAQKAGIPPADPKLLAAKAYFARLQVLAGFPVETRGARLASQVIDPKWDGLMRALTRELQQSYVSPGTVVYREYTAHYLGKIYAELVKQGRIERGALAETILAQLPPVGERAFVIEIAQAILKADELVKKEAIDVYPSLAQEATSTEKQKAHTRTVALLTIGLLIAQEKINARFDPNYPSASIARELGRIFAEDRKFMMAPEYPTSANPFGNTYAEYDAAFAWLESGNVDDSEGRVREIALGFLAAQKVSSGESPVSVIEEKLNERGLTGIVAAGTYLFSKISAPAAALPVTGTIAKALEWVGQDPTLPQNLRDKAASQEDSQQRAAISKRPSKALDPELHAKAVELFKKGKIDELLELPISALVLNEKAYRALTNGFQEHWRPVSQVQIKHITKISAVALSLAWYVGPITLRNIADALDEFGLSLLKERNPQHNSALLEKAGLAHLAYDPDYEWVQYEEALALLKEAVEQAQFRRGDWQWTSHDLDVAIEDLELAFMRTNPEAISLIRSRIESDSQVMPGGVLGQKLLTVLEKLPSSVTPGALTRKGDGPVVLVVEDSLPDAKKIVGFLKPLLPKDVRIVRAENLQEASYTIKKLGDRIKLITTDDQYPTRDFKTEHDLSSHLAGIRLVEQNKTVPILYISHRPSAGLPKEDQTFKYFDKTKLMAIADAWNAEPQARFREAVKTALGESSGARLAKKKATEPQEGALVAIDGYKYFFRQSVGGRRFLVFQRGKETMLRWEMGIGGPDVPSVVVPDIDYNQNQMVAILRLLHRPGATYSSLSADGRYFIRLVEEEIMEVAERDKSGKERSLMRLERKVRATQDKQGIFTDDKGLLAWRKQKDIYEIRQNGIYQTLEGFPDSSFDGWDLREESPSRIIAYRPADQKVLVLERTAGQERWQVAHSLTLEPEGVDQARSKKILELVGEPGTGKDEVLLAAAHLLNQPVAFLNGNGEVYRQDLATGPTSVGAYEDATSGVEPSALNQAMHAGYWYVVREGNKLTEDALNTLKSQVAAGEHKYPVMRDGVTRFETMKNHPTARIVMSSNMGRKGILGASSSINAPMDERIVQLLFHWLPPDQEMQLQLDYAKRFAQSRGLQRVDWKELSKDIAKLLRVATNLRLNFAGYDPRQQEVLNEGENDGYPNWKLLDPDERLVIRDPRVAALFKEGPANPVGTALNRPPSPRVIGAIIRHFLLFPNDWKYRPLAVIQHHYNFATELDEKDTYEGVMQQFEHMFSDQDTAPLKLSQKSFSVEGENLVIVPVDTGLWNPVTIPLHPKASIRTKGVPKATLEWIKSFSNARLLYRWAQSHSLGRDVILVGPAGAGKSTMADAIQQLVNAPGRLKFEVDGETRKEDLVFSWEVERGKTRWVKHELPLAMDDGGYGQILNMTETSQGRDSLKAVIGEVSERRQLPHPARVGDVIFGKPGFALLHDINPPDPRARIGTLSHDLIDRADAIEFTELPPEEAAKLLNDRGRTLDGLHVNPRLILGPPVMRNNNKPVKRANGEDAYTGLIGAAQILNEKIAEERSFLPRRISFRILERFVQAVADQYESRRSAGESSQDAILKIFALVYTIKGYKDQDRFRANIRAAFVEAKLWSEDAAGTDAVDELLEGDEVLMGGQEKALSILRDPDSGIEELDKVLLELQTSVTGVSGRLNRANELLSELFDKKTWQKEPDFKKKMLAIHAARETYQTLLVLLEERSDGSQGEAFKARAVDKMQRSMKALKALVAAKEWHELVLEARITRKKWMEEIPSTIKAEIMNADKTLSAADLDRLDSLRRMYVAVRLQDLFKGNADAVAALDKYAQEQVIKANPRKSGARLAALESSGSEFYELKQQMMRALDTQDHRAFLQLYPKLELAATRAADDVVKASDNDVLALVQKLAQNGLEKHYFLPGNLTSDQVVEFMRKSLVSGGSRAFSGPVQRNIEGLVREVVEELFPKADRKMRTEEILKDIHTFYISHLMPTSLFTDEASFQANREFLGATLLGTVGMAGVAWGMVVMQLAQLFLQDIKDPLVLRSTVKHELVHYLALKGFIKIPPEWESITYAVDVIERVRHAGKTLEEGEKLLSGYAKEFGEPALSQLYQRGKQLAREGKTGFIVNPGVSDADRKASYFSIEYLLSEAMAVYQANSFDTRLLMQDKYSSERAAGVLMAGVLVQMSQKDKNLKPMALLRDFFETLYERYAAQPVSRERIEELTRYASSYAGEPVTLKPRGLDGSWSYVSPGTILYPETDLYRRPSDGAHAEDTEAQDAAALERNMGSIFWTVSLVKYGSGYTRDTLPMAAHPAMQPFWDTLVTPRAVERGAAFTLSNLGRSIDRRHGRAAVWLSRVFKDRYDIGNKLVEEAIFQSRPAHLRYLDSLLYRVVHYSRNRKSIKDPRVREPDLESAVARTLGALDDSGPAGWAKVMLTPSAVDEKTLAEAVQKVIWPEYEALYDKAVRDELQRRAYERLKKEQQKETMKDFQELSEEERDELFNSLPQEVKDALQQAVENQMQQAAQQFSPATSQQGGQKQKDQKSQGGSQPSQDPSQESSDSGEGESESRDGEASEGEQSQSSGEGSSGEGQSSEGEGSAGKPGKAQAQGQQSGSPESASQMAQQLAQMEQQLNSMEEQLGDLSKGLGKMGQDSAQAGQDIKDAKQKTGEAGSGEADKNRLQATEALKQGAAGIQDDAQKLLEQGRGIEAEAAGQKSQAEGIKKGLASPEQGEGMDGDAQAMLEKARELMEKLQALQDKANELKKGADRLSDTLAEPAPDASQVESQNRNLEKVVQELKETTSDTSGKNRQLAAALHQLQGSLKQLEQSLNEQEQKGPNPPSGPGQKGVGTSESAGAEPSSPAVFLPQVLDLSGARNFLESIEEQADSAAIDEKPAALPAYDVRRAEKAHERLLRDQSGLSPREKEEYEGWFKMQIRTGDGKSITARRLFEEIVEDMAELLLPVDERQLETQRWHGPIVDSPVRALLGQSYKAVWQHTEPHRVKVTLLIDTSGSMGESGSGVSPNQMALLTAFVIVNALLEHNEARQLRGFNPVEFEIITFDAGTKLLIDHEAVRKKDFRRERFVYDMMKKIHAEGGDTLFTKALKKSLDRLIGSEKDETPATRLLLAITDVVLDYQQERELPGLIKEADEAGAQVHILPVGDKNDLKKAYSILGETEKNPRVVLNPHPLDGLPALVSDAVLEAVLQAHGARLAEKPSYWKFKLSYGVIMAGGWISAFENHDTVSAAYSSFMLGWAAFHAGLLSALAAKWALKDHNGLVALVPVTASGLLGSAGFYLLSTATGVVQWPFLIVPLSLAWAGVDYSFQKGNWGAAAQGVFSDFWGKGRKSPPTFKQAFMRFFTQLDYMQAQFVSNLINGHFPSVRWSELPPRAQDILAKYGRALGPALAEDPDDATSMLNDLLPLIDGKIPAEDFPQAAEEMRKIQKGVREWNRRSNDLHETTQQMIVEGFNLLGENIDSVKTLEEFGSELIKMAEAALHLIPETKKDLLLSLRPLKERIGNDAFRALWPELTQIMKRYAVDDYYHKGRVKEIFVHHLPMAYKLLMSPGNAVNIATQTDDLLSPPQAYEFFAPYIDSMEDLEKVVWLLHKYPKWDENAPGVVKFVESKTGRVSVEPDSSAAPSASAVVTPIEEPLASVLKGVKEDESLPKNIRDLLSRKAVGARLAQSDSDAVKKALGAAREDETLPANIRSVLDERSQPAADVHPSDDGLAALEEAAGLTPGPAVQNVFEAVQRDLVAQFQYFLQDPFGAPRNLEDTLHSADGFVEERYSNALVAAEERGAMEKGFEDLVRYLIHERLSSDKIRQMAGPLAGVDPASIEPGSIIYDKDGATALVLHVATQLDDEQEPVFVLISYDKAGKSLYSSYELFNSLSKSDEAMSSHATVLTPQMTGTAVKTVPSDAWKRKEAERIEKIDGKLLQQIRSKLSIGSHEHIEWVKTVLGTDLVWVKIADQYERTPARRAILHLETGKTLGQFQEQAAQGARLALSAEQAETLVNWLSQQAAQENERISGGAVYALGKIYAGKVKAGQMDPQKLKEMEWEDATKGRSSSAPALALAILTEEGFINSESGSGTRMWYAAVIKEAKAVADRSATLSEVYQKLADVLSPKNMFNASQGEAYMIGQIFSEHLRYSYDSEGFEKMVREEWTEQQGAVSAYAIQTMASALFKAFAEGRLSLEEKDFERRMSQYENHELTERVKGFVRAMASKRYAGNAGKNLEEVLNSRTSFMTGIAFAEELFRSETTSSRFASPADSPDSPVITQALKAVTDDPSLPENLRQIAEVQTAQTVQDTPAPNSVPPTQTKSFGSLPIPRDIGKNEVALAFLRNGGKEAILDLPFTALALPGEVYDDLFSYSNILFGADAAWMNREEDILIRKITELKPSDIYFHVPGADMQFLRGIVLALDQFRLTLSPETEVLDSDLSRTIAQAGAGDLLLDAGARLALNDEQAQKLTRWLSLEVSDSRDRISWGAMYAFGRIYAQKVKAKKMSPNELRLRLWDTLDKDQIIAGFAMGILAQTGFFWANDRGTSEYKKWEYFEKTIQNALSMASGEPVTIETLRDRLATIGRPSEYVTNIHNIYNSFAGRIVAEHIRYPYDSPGFQEIAREEWPEQQGAVSSYAVHMMASVLSQARIEGRLSSEDLDRRLAEYENYELTNRTRGLLLAHASKEDLAQLDKNIEDVINGLVDPTMGIAFAEELILSSLRNTPASRSAPEESKSSAGPSTLIDKALEAATNDPSLPKDLRDKIAQPAPVASRDANSVVNKRPSRPQDPELYAKAVKFFEQGKIEELLDLPMDALSLTTSAHITLANSDNRYEEDGAKRTPTIRDITQIKATELSRMSGAGPAVLSSAAEGLAEFGLSLSKERRPGATGVKNYLEKAGLGHLAYDADYEWQQYEEAMTVLKEIMGGLEFKDDRGLLPELKAMTTELEVSFSFAYPKNLMPLRGRLLLLMNDLLMEPRDVSIKQRLEIILKKLPEFTPGALTFKDEKPLALIVEDSVQDGEKVFDLLMKTEAMGVAQGFRAIMADNSQEADYALKFTRERIKLVITDGQHPEKPHHKKYDQSWKEGGRQVLQSVRKLRLQIPVFYLSSERPNGLPEDSDAFRFFMKHHLLTGSDDGRERRARAQFGEALEVALGARLASAKLPKEMIDKSVSRFADNAKKHFKKEDWPDVEELATDPDSDLPSWVPPDYFEVEYYRRWYALASMLAKHATSSENLNSLMAIGTAIAEKNNWQNEDKIWEQVKFFLEKTLPYLKANNAAEKFESYWPRISKLFKEADPDSPVLRDEKAFLKALISPQSAQASRRPVPGKIAQALSIAQGDPSLPDYVRAALAEDSRTETVQVRRPSKARDPEAYAKALEFFKQGKTEELLELPVSALVLISQAYDVLVNEARYKWPGIDPVQIWHVTQMTGTELSRAPNVGAVTLRNIADALGEFGLSLLKERVRGHPSRHLEQAGLHHLLYDPAYEWVQTEEAMAFLKKTIAEIKAASDAGKNTYELWRILNREEKKLELAFLLVHERSLKEIRDLIQQLTNNPSTDTRRLGFEQNLKTVLKKLPTWTPGALTFPGDEPVVLIVDDSEPDREKVFDLLMAARSQATPQLKGFRVIMAADAQEAGYALKKSREKIKLIITDSQHPGTSHETEYEPAWDEAGIRLLRVARKLSPILPVFYVSSERAEGLPEDGDTFEYFPKQHLLDTDPGSEIARDVQARFREGLKEALGSRLSQTDAQIEQYIQSLKKSPWTDGPTDRYQKVFGGDTALALDDLWIKNGTANHDAWHRKPIANEALSVINGRIEDVSFQLMEPFLRMAKTWDQVPLSDTFVQEFRTEIVHRGTTRSIVVGERKDGFVFVLFEMLPGEGFGGEVYAGKPYIEVHFEKNRDLKKSVLKLVGVEPLFELSEPFDNPASEAAAPSQPGSMADKPAPGALAQALNAAQADPTLPEGIRSMFAKPVAEEPETPIFASPRSFGSLPVPKDVKKHELALELLKKGDKEAIPELPYTALAISKNASAALYEKFNKPTTGDLLSYQNPAPIKPENIRIYHIVKLKASAILEIPNMDVKDLRSIVLALDEFRLKLSPETSRLAVAISRDIAQAGAGDLLLDSGARLAQADRVRHYLEMPVELDEKNTRIQKLFDGEEARLVDAIDGRIHALHEISRSFPNRFGASNQEYYDGERAAIDKAVRILERDRQMPQAGMLKPLLEGMFDVHVNEESPYKNALRLNLKGKVNHHGVERWITVGHFSKPTHDLLLVHIQLTTQEGESAFVAALDEKKALAVAFEAIGEHVAAQTSSATGVDLSVESQIDQALAAASNDPSLPDNLRSVLNADKTSGARLSTTMRAQLANASLKNASDLRDFPAEREVLKVLAAYVFFEARFDADQTVPLYFTGLAANGLLKIVKESERIRIFINAGKPLDFLAAELQSYKITAAAAVKESGLTPVSLEEGVKREEASITKQAYQAADKLSDDTALVDAKIFVRHLINLDDRLQGLSGQARERSLELFSARIESVRNKALVPGSFLAGVSFEFFSEDASLLERFVSDARVPGRAEKWVYHGDQALTSRSKIVSILNALGVPGVETMVIGFRPFKQALGKSDDIAVLPTEGEMFLATIEQRLKLENLDADKLEKIKDGLHRLMQLLVDRQNGSNNLRSKDLVSLQKYNEAYDYAGLAIQAIERLDIGGFLRYVDRAMDAMGSAA